MGLGRYPDVTLSDARRLAQQARSEVQLGNDPIKEREKRRRAEQRASHLLADIAVEAFEARKAQLKGDGKAGRWFSPLGLHVLPKLGRMPVTEIDQIDIRDAIRPIWHEKAETAEKAIQRLSICMQHAAALGLDVDLQATSKAKALLGAQRRERKNIPALPWKAVPAFYDSLREGSVTQLALRLLILTALRSNPIRHCRLDEIEGDVWTVPAEKMKGPRGKAEAFRVPLSREALLVIHQAKAFERDGWLFPSVQRGVISDATMSRYMERQGMDARPHGFRSSFRTWCAEATETPREIAEMCLAHNVGSIVERTYRQTDYLEKRAVLMERWSQHVTEGNAPVLRMVSK